MATPFTTPPGQSEVAVPFRFDGTGAVAKAVLPEDAVAGHLKSILMTMPGERVFNPTYGAGVPSFVFEPDNPTIGAQLATIVRTNITMWEPGVSIHDVHSSPDPSSGSIGLTVSFKLTVGESLNRVQITTKGQVQGLGRVV